MNVTVSRTNLQRGLKAVSRAVAAKGPLPILTHVKVEAIKGGLMEQGALRFYATDLQLGVSIRVPADVDTEGTLALPAKLLGEIASKIPPDPVCIARVAERDDVAIKVGRSKFNVMGMSAGDFPELIEPKEPTSVELPVAALLLGLKQTAYAAKKSDAGGTICGVHLAIQDGRLELAATDGCRLAWRVEAREAKGDVSVVIPAEAVGELVRHLEGTKEANVALSVDKNLARVIAGDVTMTTRLIDGDYPRYKTIIPTEFASTALVDRESLIDAIDRVAIMARDQESVMVSLTFTADELVIESMSAVRGESRETVSIKLDGPPVTLFFNSGFLLECLRTCTEDAISLQMNAPTGAVLLCQPEDPALTCLVMPVRLRRD